MTTIDTTPEAIAALLDGVTPGPWRVEHETTLIWGHCDQDDTTDRGMGYPVSECRISPVSSWARGPDAGAGEANARFIAAARELVPALAAEIARLTADRDALSVELHEARMQAISDGAQFQMAMEDLAAERDEALIRAERSERAERAAHDAANTAIKQRDEARAQAAAVTKEAATVAYVYWSKGADAVCAEILKRITPDASTALAARDAAMRNEGRLSLIHI